jgi:hypothetical protein
LQSLTFKTKSSKPDNQGLAHSVGRVGRNNVDAIALKTKIMDPTSLLKAYINSISLNLSTASAKRLTSIHITFVRELRLRASYAWKSIGINFFNTRNTTELIANKSSTISRRKIRPYFFQMRIEIIN